MCITPMCKNYHKAISLHTYSAAATGLIHIGTPAALRRFLPLNHATLILRTHHSTAFHFMQLRLKSLPISAKLQSQLGKHFVHAGG